VTLLVVRLGALGDIVHTVPAVAAITRALPGARIDWLVERKHLPVLDLFELDVRPIAIAGGSVRAFLDAMRGLRANGYDVAMDFQGLLKSAILARSSGARRVVGFSRDALREPIAGRFYTEHVTPGPARHVIAKNLALVRAVGVESDQIRVPLKRSSEERSNERLAVLNPGAGWPNKQWPPDRFGAVAAGLRTSRNLRSVVTWGPGEEPLARAVVDSSRGAAELAPATTLPHLMTLLASAALVVSGDTGPIHLAAAAGTPIVGLFGPTDPARNGPWSVSDLTVSRFSECVCHHKRRCHRATRCLDDITVEEVLAAAEARLDRAAGKGA
jgi:lipopolysaccharide heptosyltransferase I